MVVQVKRNWCKKCHICIEICPKKVLADDAEGYAYPAEPERCNNCAQCEWICPDFAIEITEK